MLCNCSITFASPQDKYHRNLAIFYPTDSIFGLAVYGCFPGGHVMAGVPLDSVFASSPVSWNHTCPLFFLNNPLLLGDP